MCVHKHGEKYRRRLEARRLASLQLFSHFAQLARAVVRGGGEVAFEWPRNSIGWAQPPVSRLIKELDLFEALCDGCAFGMADADGHPILKPWRIVTTSARLAATLSAYRCAHDKGFTHSNLEGGHVTPASALYPRSMCTAALTALFPWVSPKAPAMPVVAVASEAPNAQPSGHVSKEDSVDDVPPSRQPIGMVFETDPAAPEYKGGLDFTHSAGSQAFPFSEYDLEIDPGQDAQVLAAVTRLLSRAEMLNSPAAKKAVQASRSNDQVSLG